MCIRDSSKPAVSPSHIVPAPSSLAAKAASAAAPPAPPPEVKPEPGTPAVAPEVAAKEENSAAALPVAAVPSAVTPSVNPSPVVVTKNDAEEIVLGLGDREWRVRGLGRNTGFESLKVTLRLTCAERWHLDNLDLCVARQRALFVDAAASETALKPELVKRDLGHVLSKLEELQEARLRAQVEPCLLYTSRCV